MLLGATSAKAANRTLMKLIPGVDFANILFLTFTRTDPQSAKRQTT